MKKAFSLIMTVMLICALCICPAYALDSEATYLSNINIVQPGNPRKNVPIYNYAWLDNIILRDDAMSVTGKEIVPRPEDYPGSCTYEEFLTTSSQYSLLFALNEENVGYAYEELIEAMYYLAATMGMTDSMSVMREYLTSKGIVLDPNEDAIDKAKLAVVYAAMKYDAVYVLYGEKVSIPVGSDLDGAAVAILAGLTGTFVPSEVDTIQGFALLLMKNYVTSFEQLPISENPDAGEIIYWSKVITAASNDYQVPVELYSETTKVQQEYVDYAYYASVISAFYDIQIDPFKLVLTMQSGEEDALQRLILKTMLDEKYIEYDEKDTTENLFNLASANNCFPLENELYCDILKYDVYVDQGCEKIWFTPFPVAGQVEGSNEECVSMRLAGNTIAPSSTTSIPLDTTKAYETILLEVIYDSPERYETAVYEFNIIKTKGTGAQQNTAGNDLVGQVQDYVNSVIPVENDKVNSIVGSVFEAVDNAVTTVPSSKDESFLTTFGGENVTYSEETTENKNEPTKRFDFDYLDELMNGMYVTDSDGNIVSSGYVASYGDEGEEESIIEKTVETVKENPEIVAAPSGLLAVGALAGYLMSKKHKVSDAFSEDEEEETEE